jgi:hypothetical protein
MLATQCKYLIDGGVNAFTHYRYGELHRINGPAIVFTDGDCAYYQYGDRHRVDGAARMITGKRIVIEWYRRGVRHVP